MASAPSTTCTIAHDYFTQRGGAERFASALIRELKPERVITAIYEPRRTFSIQADVRVEVSFLQRIAVFRKDPRAALPAFPLAWSRFRRVESNTLLCSSSGWSHAMRSAPSTKKIVYCHNPARWLYQPDDYFKDQSFALRILMTLLRPSLIKWDKIAAQSADMYLANSRAVADRVEEIYGRKAQVLHPPIAIDPDGPLAEPKTAPESFFLTVGRGRGYKNIELLAEAFESLPNETLIVVGEAPDGAPPPVNVTYLTNIPDDQLRWLYARARALVSVSHEDFGLTPLEANSMGTPALLLRAGGFLDSLAEGVSGLFIEDKSVKEIARAVAQFPHDWDRHRIRGHAAKFAMPAFLAGLNDAIAKVHAVDTTPVG